MQNLGTNDVDIRSINTIPVSGSSEGTPNQGVYLHSPVLSALSQIEPFYRSGIFDPRSTPLFLRADSTTRLQLLTAHLPEGINIRRVRGNDIGQLPIAEDGVVFYPFNSQSNMNAVTNRRVNHVLTLHGESNKLASRRPAARLYDYICVAGPLARDRYLESAIFTQAEADQGRLVMMGDSFVQTLPWIRAADPGEDGALLYCPTWEGYGNGPVNYSSIPRERGFSFLPEIAKASGAQKIIIKPHPYLGLLKPHLLWDFIAGVRRMIGRGPSIHLALRDCSLPLRLLCRTHLSGLDRIDETEEGSVPIRMGLCDISGMEAVFLKHFVASMTLSPTTEFPPALRKIYGKKALLHQSISQTAIEGYLSEAKDIDEQHRRLVFGWQTSELSEMTSDARRNWLVDYVQSDPFWKRGPSVRKTATL